MIQNVVRDCFVFLLLSFSVVVGFGLALHILHRHALEEAETGADEPSDDHDYRGDYGSLVKSLQTLFYALFGVFDPEVRLVWQSSWLSVLFCSSLT